VVCSCGGAHSVERSGSVFETAADQLYVVPIKREWLPRHFPDVLLRPARFHNALHGMPFALLQNLRDFMDNHMRKETFSSVTTVIDGVAQTVPEDPDGTPSY
jgi:hypothetical protein